MKTPIEEPVERHEKLDDIRIPIGRCMGQGT